MSCSNSGVLRTSYNQLTGGQRIALLAEATQYGVDITRGQTQFRSNAQYLAYRKAQTVARSTNGPGPVPSVIVTDLQASYRATAVATYNTTFNVLTSPSTTVINSTGQGYIGPPMPNTYWKVSDTSSSVWSYMPTLTAVHQITSITLSYYSGFNRNQTYISDATFRMTRDKNPFVPFPDTVSLLLLYAYRKRVVPAQAGDVYALGSPDQATASPITYPNTSTTLTDPALLRAFFGNGTDIIDRTTGFQFYWFTGYGGTLINNSQINEFVINYTTRCPAIPYNIPTALFSPLVVAGDGSAVVSWSPPVNGGSGPIAYYIVTATPEVALRAMIQYDTEYQLLNGVYYPAPGVGVVRSTAPSSPMTLTGLTNGTSYTFTVVAVAAGGTSAASAASDPVTPLTLPGAPLSVVANAYDGIAILTWSAPFSDDSVLPITGYHIITSPSGPVVDILESPVTISGLTNGTAYTFSIQSRSSHGLSVMAISNSVIPYGLPDPPANFTATPGNEQMSLSWNTPTNTGGSPISYYSITVKFSFGLTKASYPYVVASPFIVPGLSNGTPYKISILAVNQAFRISYSSTINSAIPYRVPDTPTLTASIDASIDASGQVLIQWSAPATGGSPILSYTVTCLQDGRIFGPYSGVFSTTLQDLSANTAYQFGIVAINAAGPSLTGLSNIIMLGPPDAPTVVSVTSSNEGVLISWTPPVNNGGFAIRMYTVTANPGGNTVSTSDTQALITGLTVGTSYTFTVTATNLVGISDPSEPSAAGILIGRPGPPTAITASFDSAAYSGEILLNWTPPVDNGGEQIINYTITSAPAGLNLLINALYTTPPIAVSLSDFVLPSVYSFTIVSSTEHGGSSIPSTPSAPILLGRPTPPTEVVAVSGNTTAVVSWTRPVTDGGYPILYYTVRAEPGGITQSVFGDDISSATVPGLTNGTLYTFYAMAGNSRYPSVWSDPSPSIPVAAPFTAPTNVIAVPGINLATVSWTPPTSNGGYTIDYYLVSAHYGIVTVVPGNTVSAVLSGLTNGASYYFTVVAVTSHAEMESLPSNTVIPANVPDAPTVTVTRGNQQITVAWSAPFNGGSPITGYTITSTPPGFSADVSANITSILATGLTNGTPYTFRVSARNTTGPSPVPGVSVSVKPATVPNAPVITGIVVANISATVSWSAPYNGGDPIGSYTVTTNTGLAVSTTDLFATIGGLVNGTTYSFTVIATNTVNSSAPSTAVTGIPRTIPSAPTKPAVVAGNTQATVYWSAPFNGGSAITGYILQTTPSTGDRTASAAATSLIVTGLTNGTSYTFTVRADNIAGPGVTSPASLAVIPATVPSAPAQPTVTAGNTQATVYWSAPSNGGSAITGYILQTTPSTGDRPASADATSLIVTGLTNGTSYTFTVRANNNAGPGVTSPASLAVIPFTVPSAPAQPTVTAGNAQATVNWSEPFNGGSAISGYTIQTTPSTGDRPASAAATSLVVTGLTSGTSYTFTVRANNNAGPGVTSPASLAVIPFTVPSAPAQPTATAGNAEATVNWSAPANNGGSTITGYIIRSTPSTGNRTAAAGAVSLLITGLANGTSYTFTVCATNIAGEGSLSLSSTAVTPATVPSAPTAVVASNTVVDYIYTVASVSWTAPANNGSAITNYYVYPYDIQGWSLPYTDLNGSAIIPDGGGRVTTTIGGLVLGKTYGFYIVAKNGVAGTSAASGLSNTITIPNVPSVPTIVSASLASIYPIPNDPYKNGSVSVTWNAPNSNGSAITEYMLTPYESPGNNVPGTTDITGSAIQPDVNGRVTALVTGLTLGSAYSFTVYATNAINSSAESARSSVVAIQARPDSPINLVATAGFKFPLSPVRCNVSMTVPVDNAVPPNPNTNGSAIIELTMEAYYATSNVLVSSISGQITASYPTETFSFSNLPYGNCYFIAYARTSVGLSLASKTSNIFTVY